MPRPSVAKSLFDAIIAHQGHADSASYLLAMVNSNPPTVENEYLDFKGATDLKTGQEIDPRKTWSEALAGFATTGGGTLIWGIDARKDSSGVDHAVALNLVPNPDIWKSRLQELHHQATDPPVPGVLLEACPDPSNGGKGFVVCYIPESEYKPHRAESANRRWIMRIGSNFVDVPPPVLRSLFFPQRQSYVHMRIGGKVEYSQDRASAGVVKAIFGIRLYNEGPATANGLIVLAKRIDGMNYLMKTQWHRHSTATGDQLVYCLPFHPGAVVDIADAAIDLPIVPRLVREMGKTPDVDFEFQVYATDQLPQSVKFHCDFEQIKSGHLWTGLPEPLPIERYR